MWNGEFLWNVADITTSVIEHVLCSLAEHLECVSCKQALTARVREVIIQWSLAKVCWEHPAHDCFTGITPLLADLLICGLSM